MNEAIPDKPIGDSKKWYFFRRVWDFVFGGHFPIRGVKGVTVEFKDGAYEISIAPKGRMQSSDAGELQTYRVKSKVGNVIFGVTWDGTTEGTEEIPIAVNHNSRQLSSETINGVTYSYTAYTDLGDGFNDTRTSDDGDTTETQIVTPMWYEDCEIAVLPISYSGVEYDNTIDDPYDLKLIEVSARCWAKVTEEA